MPNLLEKVKGAIHERQEEGKQRKQIDREAKQTARKKYMDLYREEKTKVETARMRAKAMQDAGAKSPLTRKLQPVGKALKTTAKTMKPAAQGVGNFLGNAGRNFLNSGQLDIGTPNLDFGFGSKPVVKVTSKKKKTKAKPQPEKTKIFNPLDW